MKKYSVLIWFLILMSTVSFAEELKIWKVTPVKVNRNQAVREFVGEYHSQQEKPHKGENYYTYTGLDGTRLVLGEDGFVQVVRVETNLSLGQADLRAYVRAQLRRLDMDSQVESDKLEWEYVNYTNAARLTGRKKVEGKTVREGDRVEVHAVRLNGGRVSCDFNLQWYRSQSAEKTTSSSARTANVETLAVTPATTSATVTDVWLYEDGYYYPAVLVDGKSVVKVGE